MERLLDIKDAAEFLNVSEMTIRRWTNSGKLKCYRLGGKRERRFHMSALEELLHDSQNHLLKPLGFRGQKAPDGSHMTHFYSGNIEALGVSMPYLREKELYVLNKGRAVSGGAIAMLTRYCGNGHEGLC